MTMARIKVPFYRMLFILVAVVISIFITRAFSNAETLSGQELFKRVGAIAGVNPDSNPNSASGVLNNLNYFLGVLGRPAVTDGYTVANLKTYIDILNSHDPKIFFGGGGNNYWFDPVTGMGFSCDPNSTLGGSYGWTPSFGFTTSWERFGQNAADGTPLWYHGGGWTPPGSARCYVISNSVNVSPSPTLISGGAPGAGDLKQSVVDAFRVLFGGANPGDVSPGGRSVVDAVRNLFGGNNQNTGLTGGNSNNPKNTGVGTVCAAGIFSPADAYGPGAYDPRSDSYSDPSRPRVYKLYDPLFDPVAASASSFSLRYPLSVAPINPAVNIPPAMLDPVSQAVFGVNFSQLARITDPAMKTKWDHAAYVTEGSLVPELQAGLSGQETAQYDMLNNFIQQNNTTFLAANLNSRMLFFVKAGLSMGEYVLNEVKFGNYGGPGSSLYGRDNKADEATLKALFSYLNWRYRINTPQYQFFFDWNQGVGFNNQGEAWSPQGFRYDWRRDGWTADGYPTWWIPRCASAALSGSSSGSSSGSTNNFTKNLWYGMRNNQDVQALQTVLTQQGIYSGPVTGNFFTQTLTAVKKFQAQNGITATGYVGPTTRAKINSL